MVTLLFVPSTVTVEPLTTSASSDRRAESPAATWFRTLVSVADGSLKLLTDASATWSRMDCATDACWLRDVKVKPIVTLSSRRGARRAKIVDTDASRAGQN